MEDDTKLATSGDSKEMVDITSVVEACASTLSVSDPFLCNEETFSLHDSMAALELMDRKLDCCEIPLSVYDTNTKEIDRVVPPRPPPTNLDDLPWDELDLKEACTIALEILTRMESMLGGASVSESTFTCLYAHATVLKDMQSRLEGNLTERMGALLSANMSASGTLAQQAVYAVTLGLVAISHIVHSIAVNADIYEEEDFSVQTYGLMDFFGDEGGEEEALSVLNHAIQQICQVNDNEDARALCLVLGFQHDFLYTCTSMANLKADIVRKVSEESKDVVQSGVQKLEQLQSMIAERKDETSDEVLLKRCFDLYVNRPLVGNAPIRKVAFRTPAESIASLRTIFLEVDWAVCDLLLRGTTLGRIRRMLNRISTSSVNVLSRSLVVLNLYFDERLLGQHELWSLVAQHMQQIGAIPTALMQDRYGQAFLNRLAKPTYDTLKLLVLNRNRQRAFIEAVMLEDWSTLQQEAHALDVNHRKEHELGDSAPPFFSQYVLSVTVWLMEHHVALGIELNLFYGQHDLSCAYWYRDFLLSSLLNTMTAMRQTKLASCRIQEAAPKRGKKKGAPRKKADGGSNNMEITAEDLVDEFDFMVLGLKRTMCRGLVRFIAALNQAELLHSKQFEFTSLKRRFQKRFGAFNAILQPPPLSYDDYVAGSDFSAVSPADLLASAAQCFKGAKAVIDKLLVQVGDKEAEFVPTRESELRSLAKVCVGNSVFVHKLSQQVLGDGKAAGDVSFDLQTHGQFCTIKIT